MDEMDGQVIKEQLAGCLQILVCTTTHQTLRMARMLN